MVPFLAKSILSSNLRRYDRDFQCQNGSTKRIPKRVRVKVSRTSRTDEAAERCRLHGRRPLSLVAARDGAFGDVFFAQNNANLLRKHAQNDAFGHPISIRVGDTIDVYTVRRRTATVYARATARSQ